MSIRPSSTLWQTAALAVGVLVVGALFGFIPGANVSRSHFDLETGRRRETYHFLWIPLKDEVASTLVAEELAGDAQGETWVESRHYEPGMIACGTGGGIAGSTRFFEGLWETRRFTPEARRESARRLRQTWKRSMALRSEVPTRDYVHTLWDALNAPERDAARPVTVDELPSVEGEVPTSARN